MHQLRFFTILQTIFTEWQKTLKPNRFSCLFPFLGSIKQLKICWASVKCGHRSLNLHTLYAPPHLGLLVSRQHGCLGMHVTQDSDSVSCGVQGRNYCRGRDIQWHSNNGSWSNVGPFIAQVFLWIKGGHWLTGLDFSGMCHMWNISLRIKKRHFQCQFISLFTIKRSLLEL